MTEAENSILRGMGRLKYKIVRSCKVCYGRMWFAGKWGCHAKCIDTQLYHQRVQERMDNDPQVAEWKRLMDRIDTNMKRAMNG